MNNKKLGSNFERRFCEYLSNHGYWVHFIQPSANGSQPFDVIAIKGLPNGYSVACAFDCKTISTNRFPLSRIEDNQEMAFTKLNECGVPTTYFAIEETDGSIIIISSQTLIDLKRKGVKSINVRDYESCRI